MPLTAHPTPAIVEAPCGQGIGEDWRTVRAAHELWFARTSPPAEDLDVEDLKWPGRFRRISRALLNFWGLHALQDSVATVLTEMLTNALQHGGGSDIGVRILRTAMGVQIEVADSAPPPQGVAPAGSAAEEGRGLLMIGVEADEWGYRDRAFTPGKWTWATFTAPARAEGTR
uniref:ATP-binding protein n=1 Tax=Streptomyces sp. CA-136453 TaxID=3240050 RepID=UPI003F491D64